MRFIVSLFVFLFFTTTAFAGPEAFHAGPAIPEFGKIADVKSDQPIPAKAVFKVRFDIGKGGKAGQVNRQLDTVARFFNMHVAAGMKEKNIQLAVVLHGKGAVDVTRDEYYGTRNEHALNANAKLVEALIAHKVKFYVCGQTAAYYGIEKEDLLSGVKLSLSAMTAHALLNNEGYALNPF
jgi:intracellular sulfur oxidation DsrE/DsrF family protein